MTCSHYIGQHTSRYFMNVADDRLITGKANYDATLIEYAVLSPFPEFSWIAYLKNRAVIAVAEWKHYSSIKKCLLWLRHYARLWAFSEQAMILIFE